MLQYTGVWASPSYVLMQLHPRLLLLLGVVPLDWQCAMHPPNGFPLHSATGAVRDAMDVDMIQTGSAPLDFPPPTICAGNMSPPAPHIEVRVCGWCG
ncbi:hypothetical protein B0H14DRAFT_2701206 [Mycena olivaceomarginata]|nr:hypothetical protein B0H14DRAFT_2701206 [Mycena olivaceomarginata]